MSKVRIDALQSFCEQALIKAGMNGEHARITAVALSEMEAYGIHSHGTKNVRDYINKAVAGGLDIRAEPVVEKDALATCVVDAQNGMGIVPSVQAMELAVQKASKTGLGLVTVKNSMHFGANAYYANLAAKRGMLALVMSNTNSNMTAPGAKKSVIGNNPLAFAAPAKTIPTVFLDIAMSNVAALKVIKARNEGQAVPDTWIVDENGQPTGDPSEFPQKGALQPMGGHKGYGLAVMVEAFTGVLCGGTTSVSGELFGWLANLAVPNRACHTFLAVNPEMFCDTDDYAQRIEQMASHLREKEKAAEAGRIYLPGEIEWERYRTAEKEGLLLPPDVLASLDELAKKFGLTLEKA